MKGRRTRLSGSSIHDTQSAAAGTTALVTLAAVGALAVTVGSPAGPLQVLAWIVTAFYAGGAVYTARAVFLPRGIRALAAIVLAGLAVDAFEPTLRTEGMPWPTVLLHLTVAVGVALLVRAAAHEAQRRQQRERQTGTHDPLTHLLNRQGFLQAHAQHHVTRARVLVVIDLNSLDFVNETHGHGVGDAHIRMVAQVLARDLAPHALLARWGGDEFVALLLTSEERARGALQDVLRAAPQPRPGIAAFEYGLAVLQPDEPLERALAVANQRLAERKDAAMSVLLGTDEPLPRNIEAFSRQLEALASPSDIINVGLRVASDLLGFEAAGYYELRHDDARGAVLVLTTYHGPPLPAAPYGAEDITPLGEGLVGTAAARNTTISATDYATDPSALNEWVTGGLKSVVMTPVHDAGRLVGVLGVATFTKWRAVTPQTQRLVEAVSLRLGHALERARVVDEVRTTLEGGLLSLGVALEARDLETAGHTQRVVQLAMDLGRALGLGNAQLQDLKQGAYLHDIGKLAVPDAILLKPGRLTPEEFDVMRTHAARGYDIASRIPTFPGGALDVIRHHHERWDGTGYPDYLAGSDIPLLARIFAVADVYDALTSERPYKRAWTHEEATAEIRDQAGRHFDPAVVQAFVQLTGEAPLDARVSLVPEVEVRP